MDNAVTRRVLAVVLALGLLGSLGVPSALAASIVVNSTADTYADDGVCTLREAIAAANSDAAVWASPGECAAGSGTDAITFGVGGTITLTSAAPTITSNLSIAGAGAITVSGANANRVFDVQAGTVTLAGLRITAGGAVTGAGIGISVGATLTVTNSTIDGSVAFAAGGIFNSGTLSLTNSTISGNSSTSGGGIFNNGTLSLTNSTISGNVSTGSGGGVLNVGVLTVTNSTLSGNSAGFGGGGIFASGTETLVNAIVAGNTAPVGPDIDVVAETITSSVIGVPGGMTLADILVPGGLANNGGPTRTIALALVSGNPAIDLATSAVCAAAPVNALDQRGLPRPAACDIGAYEAQPPTVAAHANESATATSTAGAAVSYTAPAGTDEQGGAASVACLPASGSTFAVGSTTVTCTATDAVGHTGSGTFQVIVAAAGGGATATPSASATPSATPSPTLLPNTAAGDGIGGSSDLPLFLGLLVVGSLVALGQPIIRQRAPFRRGTVTAERGRNRG